MIKSLTSLRGVFILFIFFHHCLSLFPGGGTMGVAFFFVLSGFSLAIGYRDRVLSDDFRYKQYLQRRLIKFYPLHWLCLIAAVPLVLRNFSAEDIPTFFVNAALLQTWIPITKVYFSYNWVSWFLADIMFFALVCPLLLKIVFNLTTKGKIVLATTICIVYLVVAFSVPQEMYHAVFYISPYMRLADFMFGIFLAAGYIQFVKKPVNIWKNYVISESVIISLIVLLVIESCFFSDSVRFFAPIYWPLIGLLIFIVSLADSNNTSKLLTNKLMVRLGELSFIFFLIHQLVLRYSELFFRLLHFRNTICFVIITLCVSLILSVFLNKVFFNPITQWLTKRSQQSMTARS